MTKYVKSKSKSKGKVLFKRSYKGTKRPLKASPNNLNVVRLNPVAYPRELYVKLRNIVTESVTATTGVGSVRRVFLGVGASPFPPQGALGAFLPPAATIPAGELLYAGMPEYAMFYDKYRTLGTKIRIEAFLVTNSTDSLVRCVMVPIGPNPDTAGTTDSLENMINQLDTYTFEQLMGYPQAQYRMVAIQTGGYAKMSFKMFRTTKRMLDFKDIRDEDSLNSDVGTTAGASFDRPASQFQWGYYVRWFNETSANQIIKYTATFKSYFNFNKRRYLQGIVST